MKKVKGNDNWFLDYAEDDEDIQIDEYDITSSPNDFNVMTLFNFIESGAIVIPGFQRNFVWDIKRSSKLIESLILGLPVPQLFIYEQARNKFLVIDGQQRLMSIYYFIKQRFPKKEKRVELRGVFNELNKIPDSILYDDDYFDDFSLKLPTPLISKRNPFHGRKYSTLGDYKTQFDLRPLRNIIVKQNSPENDDSSIYEIFNRLNSGGANLKPQEIRVSMYHSQFYEIIQDVNKLPSWRELLGVQEPDINMKDIEIILRSVAMLVDFDDYGSSMVKFLNQFSNKMKKSTPEKNQYILDLFTSFLDACKGLPPKIFISKGGSRFNIALFEAVFRTVCLKPFGDKKLVTERINYENILKLKEDEAFIKASSEGTAKLSNLEIRFDAAKKILAL
ncbi:DUF262 domain-containing protein [Serratia plymuthica]|uniref:DUF262 domain-containing protein n=1 Tax=Serratia plymuthica TaxID=82996 RepID=UPI00192941E5|nr:DUF262 domain-containing protein [Serratia plymuthica]MBL3526043.1 DUF262 domain-containing protein [Serratia plymuthica]